MDKCVETQFGSDFWRQLNYQYFIVEAPVQLNLTKPKYKKIPNYSSLQTQGLIKNILKSTKKKKSELEILNFSNICSRLNLLLMNRDQSSEPVQQLVEEMVDTICFEAISQRLETIQFNLQDIHKRSEEEQLQIYNSEATQLQQLHQQIEKVDQLSTVIMEIEDDLIKVQEKNHHSISLLQKHIQEINKSLQYYYSIKQTGEFTLKITKNKILQHQEELQQLHKLILLYQDYQVAEGIGKAKINSNKNLVTVTFDKYLCQTPIDIGFEQFSNLQRFREVQFDLFEQNYDNIFGDLQLEQAQIEMCHYCRQMVNVKNMKQCKYNHIHMNFHQYNEEILIQQRYNISCKQIQKFFQDLYSANYIIENNQIQCQKYFCNKCLKYEFDSQDLNQIDWICPLCKGLCQCIRCQRNDCIYKLKRTYIEIGGNLDDIYEQSFFEILVSNKRKKIENIPLDFSNSPKSPSENEETLTPKMFQNKKNKVVKQIRKKKVSDTTLSTKLNKFSNADSSSSSIKIKKPKEYRRLIPNDSTIFLQ